MSDINNEYEKIANMTNKEAAEIIRNMTNNVQYGRGNGKTYGILKKRVALWKAAALLEAIPDDVPISKEIQDVKKYVGLRANIKPVDESAVVVGEKATFTPGKLDSSWYGKYDKVMMEQELRYQEAYDTFMELSGLKDLVKKQNDEFNKVFITTSPPTSFKNYISRFELAEPEIPWEKMEWKQESELLSKIPLNNAYTPEAIKAGLEKAEEEKRQNDGKLLNEDEHDNR